METAAIQLKVRNEHLPSLQNLVDSAGLQLVAKGRFYSDCTVSGPADLLEVFRPKLEFWRHERESQDAW